MQRKKRLSKMNTRFPLTRFYQRHSHLYLRFAELFGMYAMGALGASSALFAVYAISPLLHREEWAVGMFLLGALNGWALRMLWSAITKRTRRARRRRNKYKYSVRGGPRPRGY